MFDLFKKKTPAAAPEPTEVVAPEPVVEAPTSPPVFDTIAWMRKYAMRYMATPVDDAGAHTIWNSRHREILGYIKPDGARWALYLSSHSVFFDVYVTAEQAADTLLELCPKG